MAKYSKVAHADDGYEDLKETQEGIDHENGDSGSEDDGEGFAYEEGEDHGNSFVSILCGLDDGEEGSHHQDERRLTSRILTMKKMMLLLVVMNMAVLSWMITNENHRAVTKTACKPDNETPQKEEPTNLPTTLEPTSLPTFEPTRAVIDKTTSENTNDQTNENDFKIDTEALEKFVSRTPPLQPFATWKKTASFCPERPMSKCEKAFYDGEWLASTYVWNEPGATDCNLKYMSTKKIKSILRGKKIFVVGDSLMRRFAEILYVAITANDEKGVNLVAFNQDETDSGNKHGKITFGKGEVSWQYAPCFSGIDSRLGKDKFNLVKEADIIILGDGTHYTTDCAPDNLQREMHGAIDTINRLRKEYPEKVFLYRALPRPDMTGRRPVHSQVKEVMRCYSTLPILDHHRQMIGRDTGNDRMTGNTWAHMNADARNFFLQSFVNYYDNFLS